MAEFSATPIIETISQIKTSYSEKARSVLFIYLIILVATGSVAPADSRAEEISVVVSRKTSDYYEVHSSGLAFLKTLTCFKFANFERATLRLFSPTSGSLIFQDGTRCSVVNVFVPASFDAGTYSVLVNSNFDGFYELIDGSVLIRAIGSDFAFGSRAVLQINSAINGFASGAITIGTGFPRSLTNIYAQNGAAENSVDLTITGLDLLTNRYNSDGSVITDPKTGSTAWPHIFFDVVGGTISGIKVYEIKIGNTTLCSLTGELVPGRYWATCDPISIPSGQFTLSGSLDPDGSLTEINEVNNQITKTYLSTDADRIFKDRFEN